MMFGGDEIKQDAMELYLFKEKMKCPIFKEYFETVSHARIWSLDLAFKKQDGQWKWLRNK